MQFTCPSGGVIEVFVFLVLDLFVCLLQEVLQGPGSRLRGRSDKLPVHVILRLRLNDAFGCNHLRRCRLTCHKCNLHRFYERHS